MSNSINIAPSWLMLSMPWPPVTEPNPTISYACLRFRNLKLLPHRDVYGICYVIAEMTETPCIIVKGPQYLGKGGICIRVVFY